MMQLLREEPNSYAISTRTGFGISTLIAAIEAALPRPKIEVKVVIPFNRGDLVSAIHERGEVISEDYLPEGTAIRARVDGQLARQIEELNV
jgi:GTP-binding protein HflX